MKFAHIADCHLGAWNKTIHKENNLKAFQRAIKNCIEEKVDFIIIAGDLFHSNIPDFEIADQTIQTLKKCKDHQIPVYMVYGSHDKGLNKATIDLLNSSDIITHIPEPHYYNLQFITDPKTGAKLYGVDGKSNSLESEFYAHYNKGMVEAEPGFKIFIFHTTIKDCMPWTGYVMPGIYKDKLPSGLDYYAGGHMHEPTLCEDEYHQNIVVPGCLYGSNYQDVVNTAKGMKRGYYIVEFNETVERVSFHPLEIGDNYYYEIVVDDMSSEDVNNLLDVYTPDVEGKTTIIKIKGLLSEGLPEQINTMSLKEKLYDLGAVDVHINSRGVKTFIEHSEVKTFENESQEDIEKRVFGQESERFNKSHPGLTARLFRGNEEEMCMDLLGVLRQPQHNKEKKDDYQNRILKESVKVLGVPTG